MLLKPLPYSDPDRLVMLWSTNAIEHRDREIVAPRRLSSISGPRAFSGATRDVRLPRSVHADGQRRRREQVVVSVVTPGTFEMLGRRAVLGRTFTDD